VKILLVDDDAAILDMMSRLLTHRGHDVQTCATPFGVSAQIVRNPPDLVVLDVMMPGLGGAGLASLIAKLELPKPPKLVLWSAMDDQALAEAALEAGGLPFISKAKRASDIANEIEALGDTLK
jgi:CheY-like chemotaxis protein